MKSFCNFFSGVTRKKPTNPAETEMKECLVTSENSSSSMMSESKGSGIPEQEFFSQLNKLVREKEKYRISVYQNHGITNKTEMLWIGLIQFLLEKQANASVMTGALLVMLNHLASGGNSCLCSPANGLTRNPELRKAVKNIFAEYVSDDKIIIERHTGHILPSSSAQLPEFHQHFKAFSDFMETEEVRKNKVFRDLLSSIKWQKTWFEAHVAFVPGLQEMLNEEYNRKHSPERQNSAARLSA